MKTQVSVETTDSERFIIGFMATGVPHKATRAEVADHFLQVTDRDKRILNNVAAVQKKAVEDALGLKPTATIKSESDVKGG